MKNLMKKVGMMMIMILSFNVSVNAQVDTLDYVLPAGVLGPNDAYGWTFVNNDYNLSTTNLSGGNSFKIFNKSQSADGGVKKKFNLLGKGDSIYTSIKFQYKISNINQFAPSNIKNDFILSILIDNNEIAGLIDTIHLVNNPYGSDTTISFILDYANLNFIPSDTSEVFIKITNIIDNTPNYPVRNFHLDMFKISVISKTLYVTNSISEDLSPNLTVFTSNKIVHISSPTDLNSSNVLIYNMNGQLVANITESIYNDTQIDLNYLNNGMYVMVLLDEAGIELVKQKISI